MGTNYYLIYENQRIHIGKQSYGWKFCLNIISLLKFALNISQLKKYRKNIKKTLKNIEEINKIYKRNILMDDSIKIDYIYTINTISHKIIEDIFKLDNIKIINESHETLKNDYIIELLKYQSDKDGKNGYKNGEDIKIWKYRCSLSDSFC